MQVILLEKIVNLGGLGDVVKVRDGFARNYLIPHGKAKRATPANVAEFERRRTELEQAQADALAKAQETARRVADLARRAEREMRAGRAAARGAPPPPQPPSAHA